MSNQDETTPAAGQAHLDGVAASFPDGWRHPVGTLDDVHSQVLHAEAAAFAVAAHGEQQRKTGGPSVVHLLDVTGILLAD